MHKKLILVAFALTLMPPTLTMELKKRSRQEAETTPIATKNTDLAKFIWSAQNGDIKKIKKFLDAGMPPDTTGNDGVTALSHAAYAGYEDICCLLIKAGANLNAADANGNTPLIWAGKANHHDIYQLLENHGAESETCNASGNTAQSYLDGTATDYVYRGDQFPCNMQ